MKQKDNLQENKEPYFVNKGLVYKNRIHIIMLII